VRLILPPEFLPCIDDAPKLRAMADYIVDTTHGWQDCPLNDDEREFLGRLLNWTADEWDSPLTLRRCDVVVGQRYRLRWKSGGEVWAEDQGYRHVGVVEVDEKYGQVQTIRTGGRWPYMAQARKPFAWWDLTLYRKGEKKPKPRRGFATETNADLAYELCKSQERSQNAFDLAKEIGMPLGPKVLYQPQGEPPAPPAEAPLAGSLFS
jgi:hypothetical protein